MDNNIAIICDCDGTLTSDTTNALLEKNHIDTKSFWSDITKKFVEKGWDPPQAYMNEILKLMKNKTIKQDNETKMNNFGGTIKPYDGVDNFMTELKDMISDDSRCIKAGINLKGYIISSGIEDLIRGCHFAKSQFDDVFACNYSTDKNGKYDSIKNITTFTEKTKFLYAINKGINGKNLRKNPYLVNAPIEKTKRVLPFKNMIYIGDSSGDIPCFSAVRSNGGHCIGIIETKKGCDGSENPYRETEGKAYELAYGRRTNHGTYSNDFRCESDLRLNLRIIIHKITDRVL